VSELLKAALAAAERGWHVFPIVPNDKIPAVKGWEQRATLDPDRIRRCWATGDYNIGVACGPSCLLVIDLDQPKPGQTPPEQWQIPGVNDGYDAFAVVCERARQPLPIDTYTVTTGRNGTHLYYQHPDGHELRNTSGAKGGGLGWLIDTRAHGGYVLAAGSIVAGRPYTVTWGQHLNPMSPPGWLTEALTPAPLPPQQPVTIALGSDRAGRYLQAAIDGQLRHLQQAAQGGRNHALYTCAVALGQLVAGGAVGQQEIEDLLTQAAHSIGLQPAETARTITSGLQAGARRPRTVSI